MRIVCKCLHTSTSLIGEQMSIPLPEDFETKAKKEKLLKNDDFKKTLEAMPEKRAALVMATLLNPTADKRELMKKAGYSPNTPSTQMFKEIDGKLGKGLLQLGITEADLLKTLHESLKAEKVVFISKKTTAPDGTVTIVKEVLGVPDHNIRLKTTEMLMKLGDYFPDQKIKIDKTTTHEHKFAEQMSLKDLKAKEIELKSEQEVNADYEVVDETVN